MRVAVIINVLKFADGGIRIRGVGRCLITTVNVNIH
jgi:hypothetical protein